MIDFGYSINADRQIDFDKSDKRILRYVLKHEPSLMICIGCGTCTATCSAGHFTAINIRLIHTMLQRGEIKTLKKDISGCMLCGKCQLACPRGVNLRNLIQSILNAAEKFDL